MLKDHLRERHVDLDLHRVWVDDVECVATFPLWNLSGQMVGYQAYRPNASKVRKNDEKGRYYTYRGEKIPKQELGAKKHTKTNAVWGLESWYLSDTLFVTEGIFDAARFTELGYSALALLSNDPDTSLKNWLMCVRQTRKVVAVCDPDGAGIKLAKSGHVAHFLDAGEGVDIGDAPHDYVMNLINTYR